MEKIAITADRIISRVGIQVQSLNWGGPCVEPGTGVRIKHRLWCIRFQWVYFGISITWPPQSLYSTQKCLLFVFWRGNSRGLSLTFPREYRSLRSYHPLMPERKRSTSFHPGSEINRPISECVLVESLPRHLTLLTKQKTIRMVGSRAYRLARSTCSIEHACCSQHPTVSSAWHCMYYWCSHNGISCYMSHCLLMSVFFYSTLGII